MLVTLLHSFDQRTDRDHIKLLLAFRDVSGYFWCE